MSLHVVCALRHGVTPASLSLPVAWTETLPSSGGLTANPVPADGRPWVLFLVAEAKMYVDVGARPDANSNPRRLMLAGDKLEVVPAAGDRVHWVTKP